MFIDTDVNSRFHSSTLIWIPVILLSSAKQTTTKYEQVLYWRHTCIYFLAVFYTRCLNIHGLPPTFQKLINCIIRGIGMGRGCGNNRFGNMDNWWVHVLEGARVAQWWEHSPPTNVAWVQIPMSMPYVGWVCCWFSPLLREVFLRVLRFSPLLKNQHFQIPIRSGTHGHV